MPLCLVVNRSGARPAGLFDRFPPPSRSCMMPVERRRMGTEIDKPKASWLERVKIWLLKKGKPRNLYLYLLVGAVGISGWFSVSFLVDLFASKLGQIKDPAGQITQIFELVKTLALVGGGVAFIFGAWNTVKTLHIAQEGQITDRFHKATEQLGKDSIEQRLGGIYALERIAHDSERDHWPVMEVLTAFIRQNSPWPPSEERQKEEKERGEIPPLPVDIQAALTVIGRRKWREKEKENQILDLRNTDLRRAELDENAHFERANFYGAHLEEAVLIEAHLEWARLRMAHLEGANLEMAHLEHASLSGGAHLEHAVLVKAHLEHAYLAGAHLEKAILWMAHLEGAHLEHAFLAGAALLGAHLKGAHLDGADLSRAKDLTQPQIDSAHGDEHTKLPPELEKHRPAHWLKGEG